MKSINRFVKVFPWFSGLEGDLLFYIAIDTLFLTIVKNFSASQIVSMTSFSQFACIALQFPVLFLIRKIGNTNSVRTGALFLLLSSIFITFGKSFYLVLLGRIFHDIARIFRSASYVMLENNLEVINRRSDFIKTRAAANTVYAVITMLISFVASFMFNLNNYLPMIGCITTCTIGFILSFYMKDYSKYNIIPTKKEYNQQNKFRYTGFIILAISVYGLFYPIVTLGQSEGKLFIQQQILLDFNTKDTTLIIGAIVCVSRVIRVLSNILFARLYYKYKAKMGVILTILLGSSMGFMILGSFNPQVILKIIIMAIGYIIILFIRDPFTLYMQDVLFENTPQEQHQTLLTMLEFGVKLGTAVMGLGFAAILLTRPMLTVISIMFAISIVEIVLSLKLYKISTK